MLGVDRHPFDPKEYSKIMESRKIFDNYLSKIDVIDVEIRQLILEKRMPLILKEEFYLNGQSSNLIPITKQISFKKTESLDLDSKQDSDEEFDPFNTMMIKTAKDKRLLIEKTETNDFGSDKNLPEIIEKDTFGYHSKIDTDILKIVQNVINSEQTIQIIKEDQIIELVQMDIPDEPENKDIKKKKSKSISSKIDKKEKLFDEHIHVFFMLHGLEGSSNDMRNLQSLLQTYLPKAIFYRSEINEDHTNDNIEELGLRLAGEVRNFLDNYLHYSKLEITFIGHSLGGLIARAAFPHLADFKSNFKTFVSLSCPHLGSISSKFLVNTGMRVLAQMKNNKSIRQMSLEDEELYLLKLSKAEGFGWFKNVILFSVQDDGYVPLESARVLSTWKHSNSSMTQEMAFNIYSKLTAQNLVKILLYIPGISKGIDVFLGRQAHIELIENSFLRQLVFSHIKEFF